jgi:hypothetical protein
MPLLFFFTEACSGTKYRCPKVLAPLFTCICACQPGNTCSDHSACIKSCLHTTSLGTDTHAVMLPCLSCIESQLWFLLGIVCAAVGLRVTRPEQFQDASQVRQVCITPRSTADNAILMWTGWTWQGHYLHSRVPSDQKFHTFGSHGCLLLGVQSAKYLHNPAQKRVRRKVVVCCAVLCCAGVRLLCPVLVDRCPKVRDSQPADNTQSHWTAALGVAGQGLAGSRCVQTEKTMLTLGVVWETCAFLRTAMGTTIVCMCAEPCVPLVVCIPGHVRGTH